MIGLFFGTLGAFYVVAEISISTRLVLFARREWAYEIDAANGLLSLFFLGLFVGRFAAALFRFPWRSSSILKVSAVVGLVFYILGITVHPSWLALAGIPLSVFYPCMIAMVNEEQRAHAGYITSWCITLQSFGVMVMHFVLGGLTDVFGLRGALWTGPLVLALVLIFLERKAVVSPSDEGLHVV
jgi:fucose permease